MLARSRPALKTLSQGFARLAILVAALLALLGAVAAPALAQPAHGIAMHGEPALPPDFPNLPYANPDAPKGGQVGYANVGTFDSLNPFIVQGTAPRGLWDETWGRNIWESLLVRNRAEPFTLYGLLAESVEVPEDRTSIAFTIRPEARFSDGKPVTADDVIFSAELLRTKGRPNFRNALNRVARIEKTGERSLTFHFTPEGDRELPMIIGLGIPILPKHAVNAETFDRTSFDIPIGSGPYRIEAVDPGTSVLLRKNPDYWGKDLPIKRGFDNFDAIRVEYFRDANTFFEAFKKGLFSYLPEADPTRWSSGYDFPAAKDGRVVMADFETGVPKPMKGFVFNTRREIFADPKVREALTYFLDFEWMNRVLYFGLYERTGSFFHGSELSALGEPASPAERQLLAPFPDAVRPEVMEGTYRPPEGDGSGRNRENLRAGLRLLAEAGFRQGSDGKLVNAAGTPLSFEILVQTREDERLALAYQRSLALAGIEARVRLVDATQYWERLKGFEFDMIPFTYASSLSPGTEQNFRWASANADVEGTFNFAGVKSPAVDAMIEAVLAAKTREDFVAAVRALDRVLISGFYLVPLFHPPAEWVAYWASLQRPENGSLYGPEPTTWWAAPQP